MFYFPLFQGFKLKFLSFLTVNPRVRLIAIRLGARNRATAAFGRGRDVASRARMVARMLDFCS
jgi:hypothetical protein